MRSAYKARITSQRCNGRGASRGVIRARDREVEDRALEPFGQPCDHPVICTRRSFALRAFGTPACRSRLRPVSHGQKQRAGEAGLCRGALGGDPAPADAQVSSQAGAGRLGFETLAARPKRAAADRWQWRSRPGGSGSRDDPGATRRPECRVAWSGVLTGSRLPFSTGAAGGPSRWTACPRRRHLSPPGDAELSAAPRMTVGDFPAAGT